MSVLARYKEHSVEKTQHFKTPLRTMLTPHRNGKFKSTVVDNALGILKEQFPNISREWEINQRDGYSHSF